jgi:hypothetical protein
MSSTSAGSALSMAALRLREFVFFNALAAAFASFSASNFTSWAAARASA